MSKQFVVTFTSMVIDAQDEDEAIDRAGEFKGGGNWEAQEVHLEAQPATEVSNWMYFVHVSGCTAEQAEQVINERIKPDEDYGFDYTIDWEPA